MRGYFLSVIKLLRPIYFLYFYAVTSKKTYAHFYRHSAYISIIMNGMSQYFKAVL